MSDAQTHFTMFGVVLLMSTLIALAGARVYERCELARDLLKLGVNRDDVATWVCIAFHESRFDTAARNPHSGDHGLLQISELYWCGPGKACGVPCSAFRNDDISDDVQCALQIHKEHTRLQGNGFLAWVVYPHHCKHNAKKYLVDCDTSVKNSPTKFDDRSRHLKSFQRNVTNKQNEYLPDIDNLKPNYLAISKLFKGSYENQFEENYYRNKAPVNWINFKINNIDELKLPNLNRNINVGFTTPPTTTTTIDPALKGIKPPMPRRIESNQFRRRMMNFISEPTKNYDKHDYVPKKIFTEAPSTNQIFEKIDLSHNPFINRISTKATTAAPKLTFTEMPPTDKIYEPIDLSHNPFINLHRISTKTSTEAPKRTFTEVPPPDKVYEPIDLSHNPFINLHRISTKTSTEAPKRTFTEVPPSDKVYEPIDLSHNPFINLHRISAKTSTEAPYRTRGLSRYNPNYITAVTLTTPKTTISASTASEKIIVTQKSSYNNTTNVTSTTSRTTTSTSLKSASEKTISMQNQSISHIPTPNSITPRRGKSRYVPEYNYEYTRTRRPLTSSTTTSRPLTTTSTSAVTPLNVKVSSTTLNLDLNLKVNSSKENDDHKIGISETTTQASQVVNNNSRSTDAAEGKSSPLDGSSSDINPNFETTPKPLTTSTTSDTPRSSRFDWDSWRNIHFKTSRSPTTSTTTRQPTTTTTLAPTSQIIVTSKQSSPVATQNATTTPSESSTMKSTTWSIFDLYLNPTKATIRPFSFTPFGNSPHKLRIFSGGTTTPPSSFLALKQHKR